MDYIKMKDLKGAVIIGGKHLCGQVVALQFRSECGTEFYIDVKDGVLSYSGLPIMI